MSIAPFINGHAFAPDVLRVMNIAFDDAYRALQINDRTDPLTEIIARKIINLALHGERDPIQLRDKTLQTAHWPSLIELYRFFVRVHGSDEAAAVDFERFMSGEIPQHILQYCRISVEMELPSSLNMYGSHVRTENPVGAFSPLASADHGHESVTP
jgi:hypothetical protein